MSPKLQSAITRVLMALNVFLSRVTDRRCVQALMEKLYPRRPSSPLVRLGSDGDGGYVLPDDFEGIAACFSPGVGKSSAFEYACADRGMRVFMADGSVERPAEAHERFQFIAMYIGSFSDERTLSLERWVTQSLPGDDDSELLLQMDIEGHEYEVILSASEGLMQRFRILVIEFHGLSWLWSKPYFEIASRAFEKILRTHACVHIHPNNFSGSLKARGLEIPYVMEFTFLRRDRLREGGYRHDFPHALDQRNLAVSPSLPLPGCWYAGPGGNDG